MSTDMHPEIGTPHDVSGTRYERRGCRIADFCASEPQFAAAMPDPATIEAARHPELRLAEILQTFVNGYADRPAVGQRARALVTDPVTGRTSAQLLARFDMTSYRDLWERVTAIATDWRHDPAHPLSPGDFVVTIGFASPDYLAVDLACAYLGLVSVPLQHTAPASQLKPIIDEVEPKVVAVSAPYLELAVESALGSASLRHLLVFDYQPELDDHRESLERARTRLQQAGVPANIDTLAEVVDRGRARRANSSTPPAPTSGWR